MSLADGEYEIDLSVLLDPSSGSSPSSSVALRYGFVPDSMDQTAPLRLFHNDRTCVLEAQAVQARAGTSAPLIIFEGFPQQQRTQPGSGQAILDLYFLSVSLHGAKLGKFDSIVRLNKSRSADKWRGMIAEWGRREKKESGAKATSSDKAAAIVAAEKPKKSTPADVGSQGVQKTSTEPHDETRTRQPYKNVKTESKARPAERPPPPKPKSSVSRSSSASIPQTAPPKEVPSKVPAARPVKQARVASKRPPVAKQDGDDFADLENELMEALGETESSDEDEPQISLEPIRIEVDEPRRKPAVVENVPLGRRPMSLRELYGERADYGSSSEEE